MKKGMVFLLICFMLVFAAACGETETSQNAQTGTSGEAVQASAETEASQGENSNALIAYFTYAENAELPDGVDASASASIQVADGERTGNTGMVARMIQDAIGADLFSIRTEESYPDNYEDTVDQGQEEQAENARPRLTEQIENPDQYDTVFLGFPNWWGDMPMAVYSFLEEYDLSGKTIVPFVTSGGSGFSGTVSEIETLEPDAEVQEGLSIGASSVQDARNDVESWLRELGYME